MTDTTLSALRSRAAELLRQYSRSDAPEAQTATLREVANVLVDARSRFYAADGTPDWRGRTYAYRRWVGEVYGEANLDAGDVSSVQAAVRYHVGNALRERLDSTTLEDLGLRSAGPRERSVEKRQRQAEVLARLMGGPITDPGEALEALHIVQRLLDRLDANAVKGLDAASRKDAREVLNHADEVVDNLAKAAGRRR